MTRAGRGGPFVVPVAVLRKHPGSRRRLQVSGPIADLDVSSSRVKAGSPVDLDVVLESVLGGVVVTGTVSASWEGECRRCLETAVGRLDARVREVYTDQADPEIEYAMTDDWLDLEHPEVTEEQRRLERDARAALIAEAPPGGKADPIGG